MDNQELLELGEHIFKNESNLSEEDLLNKKLAYAETIWMFYETYPTFSLELIKMTNLVKDLWEEEKINKSLKKLWAKIPQLNQNDQELISLLILEHFGLFNLEQINKILFTNHLNDSLKYSPSTILILKQLGYEKI